MRILSFFFMLIFHLTHAQSDQKAIDEQVWKPFTIAIMNQDVDAFVALHSKDLVRAELNRGSVFGLKDYQDQMKGTWPLWKESLEKDKATYTFELRFLQRISNGELAYDVGYFKNKSVMPDGTSRISYGKFQVALRKESNIWKILVDSDSNEGGTITEEMFLKASPMQ